MVELEALRALEFPLILDARMEEKIKTWLRQQGYPLELRVGQLLRARGWDVEHSAWYTDPDTSKLREMDIRATIYKGTPSPPRWLSVSLVIECKSSPEKPWIVFAAPRDTVDLQIANSVVADEFSRDLLYSVPPEVGLPECLRPTTDPGHGLTRAFSDSKPNDPSGPYAALRGVIGAATVLGKKNEDFALRSAPDHMRAELILPLVVLEGLLFRYSLDDADQEQLSHAQWIQTAIASPIDGTMVLVTIVTRPALDDFLRYITPQLQQLCSRMVPYLENIHGLAVSRRSRSALT